MASIFRKLTGKRRKNKAVTTPITVNTSTESSHTSDRDNKTSRRPQHLYIPSESSPQDPVNLLRSRSSSKDLSSPDSADDPSRRSPTERKKGKRRFSLTRKKNDKGKEQLRSSTTSAKQYSFGVSVGNKGQQSRLKEDHEIFAPPGMTPKKLRSQEARRERTLRERQKRLGRVRPDNDADSVSTATSELRLSTADAKQHAINKETERIARAAAALDNRGNEYFERGYYDKAMESYSKALKLKRRTFHSMLEEADDLFEDEENDQLDSDMDPKLLVSMATSINNIGYLRQRAGEATPDEAMIAYKKSLRIKRKILGNDSLSVGKTLNNIGSVHYLKKDYDGAFPAYGEALQIMQSTLGADHPDVATVMSNMGDVCLAMGKRDESLQRYRSALEVRWTAFGDKDPRTVRLLEKIARIEIGDKMPTPRGNNSQSQKYDWDESELYDLDMRPLSHELRLLHESVQEDMQYVDMLEKKMAVGMVKDKVKIVRGMRDLAGAYDMGNSSLTQLAMESSSAYDSSQRDDSVREEDDLNGQWRLSSLTSPMTKENREAARKRVRERLAHLRSETPTNDPPTEKQMEIISSSSLPDLGSLPDLRGVKAQGDGEGITVRRASDSSRPNQIALSSVSSDTTDSNNGGIKSALKLKKGIDSLRAFATEEDEAGKFVRATWLGEVES